MKLIRMFFPYTPGHFLWTLGIVLAEASATILVTTMVWVMLWQSVIFTALVGFAVLCHCLRQNYEYLEKLEIMDRKRQ